MRNTDTTKQDKGLRPLTPAAHQTAGRKSAVVQLDTAQLGEVKTAIWMQIERLEQFARDEDEDGKEDLAVGYRARAAILRRTVKQL